MRSNEIFARMSPEEAQRFLGEVTDEAPDVATLTLGAVANAFRLRPEFLKRQSRERQAAWMRRALGRTVGAALAEEVLATYFLEHHAGLLTELLDSLGVPHAEGRLSEDHPPCPEAKALEKAVKAFRKGGDPERRELLLHAFAAQSAIEWPALDAILTGGRAPAETAPPKARAEPKAKAKPKPRPKSKARPKAKTKRKRRG